MDGQRFDRLSKALVTSAKRRNVLKGLIGGTFGGLLLGQRGAGADEHGYYSNRGQRCSGDAECNSPCRACIRYRCVYRCAANQWCDANSEELSPSGVVLSGRCVTPS